MVSGLDNNVHTRVFEFRNSSCNYVLRMAMVAVQVVILLLECYSDGGAPLVSLYLENEIFKERNGMLRMAVRD
eukprot:scaffold290943_cov122-Cyclotella_meneghiniana.AAC.3